MTTKRLLVHDWDHWIRISWAESTDEFFNVPLGDFLSELCATFEDLDRVEKSCAALQTIFAERLHGNFSIFAIIDDDFRLKHKEKKKKSWQFSGTLRKQLCACWWNTAPPAWNLTSFFSTWSKSSKFMANFCQAPQASRGSCPAARLSHEALEQLWSIWGRKWFVRVTA